MNPLTYIKLGAAALVLAAGVGLWLYVSHLQSARDEALAQVASLQATNNELAAVHANDMQALKDLTAANAAAEAARSADAARQQVITRTVVQWKAKVINAPPPTSACNAATSRDAAVLTGLRDIIGAPASDPNSGGQSAAAGGADGGHSAAGPPKPASNP